MAALTESIEVIEKSGLKVAEPMAVDVIFRGALLKTNAAGFVAPCASEAGAKFSGIAYEEKDNSAGSAGDVVAKVIKEGRFLLTGTSFAQTDVGVPVYASDDQTITKTYAADLQRVGVIDEFVSATQVYVRIEVGNAVGETAVADLGSTTDIPGSALALSTSDTYTDAAVNTAVNAAVDVVAAVIETRLDNIEGKLDSILDVLRKNELIQG